MKKFYFDELQEVSRILTAASDEKSQTVITIGAKTIEKKLMCVFRSNTTNRQVVLRTICDMPKDWEEHPVQIVVKTQSFVNVIQTLSAYKDAKMHLALGDKDVTIGVDAKAKIKMPLLAEVPVEVKAGKIITQFTAGEGFEAFLRKGCGCAAQGLDQTRLLHNTVLLLNTETGSMRALSTDGFTMACAKCEVKMPKEAEGNEVMKKRLEEIAKNLEEFVSSDEKQKKEALVLCIPGESMNVIRQLIAGQKSVGIAADERHLLVQATPNVMLTVTRGTGTSINASQMEMIFKQQGEVCAAVDHEALLRGVSLCNKVAALSVAKDTAPLEIEVKKDALSLAQGTGKQKTAETKVPLLGKTGESVTISASGKKMEAVLHLLDKGGIVIRFIGEKMMLLANGNLADGAKDDAGVALALVRRREEEEETDPEEVEEGTEAEAEGIEAA